MILIQDVIDPDLNQKELDKEAQFKEVIIPDLIIKYSADENFIKMLYSHIVYSVPMVDKRDIGSYWYADVIPEAWGPIRAWVKCKLVDFRGGYLILKFVEELPATHTLDIMGGEYVIPLNCLYTSMSLKPCSVFLPINYVDDFEVGCPRTVKHGINISLPEYVRQLSNINYFDKSCRPCVNNPSVYE